MSKHRKAKLAAIALCMTVGVTAAPGLTNTAQAAVPVVQLYYDTTGHYLYQDNGSNIVNTLSVNGTIISGTEIGLNSDNTTLKDNELKLGNTKLTESATGGTLTLGTNSLTDAQLGYLNTAVSSTGALTGAKGSNIGGVIFGTNGGADGVMTGVTSIDGAAVSSTGTGSELTISGVTLDNGTVKATSISSDGTAANTITVASLVATKGNTGGITRDTPNQTTTIEGTLAVDGTNKTATFTNGTGSTTIAGNTIDGVAVSGTAGTGLTVAGVNMYDNTVTATTLQAGTNTTLTEGTLKLGNGTGQSLAKEEVAALNTALNSTTGALNGAKGSNIGGVIFGTTGGADGVMTGVTSIDGAAVSSTGTGSELTISGVTLDNGTVKATNAKITGNITDGTAANTTTVANLVATQGNTAGITRTTATEVTAVEGVLSVDGINKTVTIDNGSGTNKVVISANGIKVGTNSTVTNEYGFFAGGDDWDASKAAVSSDGRIKAANGVVNVATDGTTTFGSDTTDQTKITKGTATFTNATGTTAIAGNTIDGVQVTGGSSTTGLVVGSQNPVTLSGTNAISSTGFTVDKDGNTNANSLTIGATGAGFTATGALTAVGATFTSDLSVKNGTAGTETFKVTAANGAVSAAGGNFTVDGDGNTAVAGTLDVTGATTLQGTTTIGTGNNTTTVTGGKAVFSTDGTTANTTTVDGGNVTLGGAITATSTTATHTIGNVQIKGNLVDSTATNLVVEGVQLENGSLKTGNIILNGTNSSVTADSATLGGMTFSSTDGINTVNRNIDVGTGTISAGNIGINGTTDTISAGNIKIDGINDEITGVKAFGATNLTASDTLTIGKSPTATSMTSDADGLKISNNVNKVNLGDTTLTSGGATFGANATDQTVIANGTVTAKEFTDGTATLTGGNFSTTGSVTAGGGVTVDTNNSLKTTGLTASSAAINGNETVTGTLAVTGASTLGNVVVDGSTINNKTTGEAVTLEGVSFNDGTMSNAAGTFKVDANGAITGANNSTIGGVTLGANGTSGAMTGVTSIDGAAVSGGTNHDLTVSGVNLNNGKVTADGGYYVDAAGNNSLTASGLKATDATITGTLTATNKDVTHQIGDVAIKNNSIDSASNGALTVEDVTIKDGTLTTGDASNSSTLDKAGLKVTDATTGDSADIAAGQSVFTSTGSTTTINGTGLSVAGNGGNAGNSLTFNANTGETTFTSAGGSTIIDGNTITTDTLKTNIIQLGNGSTYNIQLSADGSASLANGRYVVSKDGDLSILSADKSTAEFSVDSDTGATSMAAGKVTVAADGTTTFGTDTTNQTVIANGNFNSKATSGTKSNITSSTADSTSTVLSTTGGTTSTQSATSDEILDKISSSDSKTINSTDRTLTTTTDTIQDASGSNVTTKTKSYTSDIVTAGNDAASSVINPTHIINQVTDGKNTTTVTESATLFSVQGGSKYGLAIEDTNTGVTTVTTADGVTTLDGGTASFTNGNKSVSIKDGSATFTSDNAGTSSQQGTTTTIDGGVITTDTLDVQKIILGENIVDSTGKALSGTGTYVDLNSDGTATFNNVLGNVTGTFTSGASGISATMANANTGVTTVSKAEDGKITNSVSDATQSNNSVRTLTTTTDTVTDGTNTNTTTNTAGKSDTKVTNGTATASNTLTPTSAVTSVNDGTNTSTISTNGTTGTTFTNSAQTTHYGSGSQESTVINGNTITTGKLTTDELVITGTKNASGVSGNNSDGSIVLSGDGSFSSTMKSATATSTLANDINGVKAEATDGTNAAKNDVTASAVTSEVTDGTYTGKSDVAAKKVANGVTNADGSVMASSVNTVDDSDLATTTDTVKDAQGSNVTVRKSTTNVQTIADTNGNTTVIENNADGVDTTVSSGTNKTSTGVLANSTYSTISDGTNTNATLSDATSTTQKINTTTFKNDATGSSTTVDGHTATVTGSDVTINSGESNQIKLSELGQVKDVVTDIQSSTVVGSLNNEYDQRVAADVQLGNRIDDVSERLNRVGAMSAAIANLKTMGYDPAAPTEITAAVGGYKGDKAIALGVNHYSNKDIMLTMSYAQSGSERMGGIGATFRIGRTNAKDVIERERRRTQKRIEEAQTRAIAAHELYQKAVRDAELAKKYAEAASKEEIRQAARDEANAQQEYENTKEKYNQELAPSFKVK